jgi:hypothetical protein
MNTLSIIGASIVTLALISYSIGILTEQFKKKIISRVLIFGCYSNHIYDTGFQEFTIYDPWIYWLFGPPCHADRTGADLADL